MICPSDTSTHAGPDAGELIHAGNALSLGAAAKLLQVDGRPPSSSTLSRWAMRGVKVGRRRIRLKTRRVGKRLTTSAEAVRLFRIELDAAHEEAAREPEPAPPQTRKRSASERQAIEAERELAALGL